MLVQQATLRYFLLFVWNCGSCHAVKSWTGVTRSALHSISCCERGFWPLDGPLFLLLLCLPGWTYDLQPQSPGSFALNLIFLGTCLITFHFQVISVQFSTSRQPHLLFVGSGSVSWNFRKSTWHLDCVCVVWLVELVQLECWDLLFQCWSFYGPVLHIEDGNCGDWDDLFTWGRNESYRFPSDFMFICSNVSVYR